MSAWEAAVQQKKRFGDVRKGCEVKTGVQGTGQMCLQCGRRKAEKGVSRDS